MGEHARLSPSASKIWMACPGQPTLAAGIESTSSSYAERGTAAHELLENSVSRGKWLEPGAATWPASNKVSLIGEDIDAVKIAYDFIQDEIANGDEWETEVKLRYSNDLWGTADFVRYRPSTGELLVVDYKHGSGVAVDAEGNPQGLIYALMKVKALANRGYSTVRFVIVQPRCFHADGPIREYTVDGADMLEWEDDLVAAISAVDEAAREFGQARLRPDGWWRANLKAGDHCRWCPAASTCPALKAMADDALTSDFAPVEEVTADHSQLADALKKRPLLETWLKAVDEAAYRIAEKGGVIPGFKLVAKRPTARWRDPEEANQAIQLSYGLSADDIHEEPKLLSPAQMRALLEPSMEGKTKKARTEAAKKELDQFTENVSSGHALVPDGDPRPPIRPSAADDFSAVDTTETEIS
jgi:hypothetical protein